MARKSLRQRTQKLKLTQQYGGTYKGSDGKIYSSTEGIELLMTGKAERSKWKSAKHKGTSYEGGQYTGGRQKGRANLKKKEDGTLVNQYGVEITPEEKKRLESRVNQANRLRMKMIEEEGKLPRLKGGKDTGDNVSSLQAMGKESDFILSRKSKSLQRFKSRKDFDFYMENLDRVLSPDYLDKRTELYKQNHIKALQNVFGDMADDVADKIRNMDNTEYRKWLQSDEEVEISYIYDPGQLAGRLNQIRASFKMELKEEPM